jgi:hypothetical protein
MELHYNKKVIIGFFISCVLTSAIEMNHPDFSPSGFLNFFLGETEKKPIYTGPMSIADPVAQAPIQGINGAAIIVVPSNCPENYKADLNGKCRSIF